MTPDLTNTSSIHGTTWPLYQHSLRGIATETIYCQSFHNPLFTTQPLSYLLALCVQAFSVALTAPRLPFLHSQLQAGWKKEERQWCCPGKPARVAPSGLSLGNAVHERWSACV